jgi:hypothetical protein
MRKEMAEGIPEYASMFDTTSMLRAYADLRSVQLQAQDPIGQQQAVLKRLLRRAAGTRFGRDHGFSKISSVKGFQEREPPRLLVTGRTSYVLSTFGEHLIAEEIEEAVGSAASDIGASIADYAVGAVFPEQQAGAGRHLYLVEFRDCLPDAQCIADFAHKLDRRLKALNADYGEHRARDFGLRPPQVQPLRPGTFAAWMKSRGKLGGQHKVPRIINDPQLFDHLRKFAAQS